MTITAWQLFRKNMQLTTAWVRNDNWADLSNWDLSITPLSVNEKWELNTAWGSAYDESSSSTRMTNISPLPQQYVADNITLTNVPNATADESIIIDMNVFWSPTKRYRVKHNRHKWICVIPGI